MKQFRENNQNPGTSATRCNSRKVSSRPALQRGHNDTAGRARARRSVIAAAMLLVLAAGVRAQQAQTPTAATVYAGYPPGPGGSYDWVPYTGIEPFLEHQWSPENVGTPVINDEPPDIRRGGSPEVNSASVIAGGDMFVVSIDQSGDAKQSVRTSGTNPAGTGDVSFIYYDNPLQFSGNASYQGVLLWRLDPATGAVRNGYPKRLDLHTGVCYLPRIAVTVNGNLFVAWKETVPGSGDRIEAAFVTVATDVVTGPDVRSGFFPDIRELSLASSTGINTGAENAAVLFRVHSAGDEIYAEDFNNTLAWWWNGTDVRVDDPSEPASQKWNPIIKWNDVSGCYDMAWGDGLHAPSGPSLLMVQSIAPVNGAPAPLYGTPEALNDVTVTLDYGSGYPCEFYMEPVYGYGGAGETLFFFRDGSGYLKVVGAEFEDGGPLIMNVPNLNTLGSDPVPKGYPMSFTKRLVPGSNPPQEDMVAVYKTTNYAANGFTDGIYANYVDMTGYIANAPQLFVDAPPTPSSTLYKSFGAVSDNATMFLAVPNTGYDRTSSMAHGEVDMYGIGFSSSPVSLYLVGPGGPLAKDTTRSYHMGEPCFSAAMVGAYGGHLCLFNFQYGLSFGANPYAWTDEYMDRNNPETDERFRADYENATYDVTSYTIQSSWPYLASPDHAGIEDNTVNTDPNTAALGRTSATVYSQATSDGVSNIILGVNNSSSWNITNATGGDAYYEPEVGLYLSGDTTCALVTYVHELAAGGSAVEDVSVNLWTGEITPDPWGPIESSATNRWFRNWGIVLDSMTGNFVCVYADTMGYDGATYTDELGTIKAVGFTGAAKAWWPKTVSQLDFSDPPYPTRDQVRICYKADSTNSGVYVAWRETTNPNYPSYNYPGTDASLEVQAVGSANGKVYWAAPAQLSGWAQGTPNNRRNPCVCAGPANAKPLWVFVGWEDQGVDAAPAPYRIWGETLDTAGVSLNGGYIGSWLTGVVCSDCSPEESHHPDAIANPINPNEVLVAYDRDALAAYSGNPAGTNGLVNIELRNFDLTLTQVGNPLDIPNPARAAGTVTLPTDASGYAWGMDDAKWSLYGTMQRRPKLIAIKADSSAFPHLAGSSPAYWVMCVYESEAYDLYQQPPTVSGGAAPTYGLAQPYLNMWLDEMNRGEGITAYPPNTPTPDPTAGYLQNNILATVVNPSLGNVPGIPASPYIAAHLAVFANTNAQDLKCVTYNDELGPMVTCIDYTNSDNTTGIVRMDQVIPNYYFMPGIVTGQPLQGTWPAPVSPAYTASAIPPEYFDYSWFPLVLHPAVGSPDCFPVPPNPQVWSVDAANPTITLDPETPEPAPVLVDYYGNWNTKTPPVSIENELTVTAHAECIATQWPLTLPIDWGNTGNTITNQGVGLKPAAHGASGPGDEFSVALTDNPASSSESAVVTGIPGRTASIRVLNALGQTVQKVDGVTIGANGTSVPLVVAALPSGNYIIEAIGDEGSHARTMLSVQH